MVDGRSRSSLDEDEGCGRTEERKDEDDEEIDVVGVEENDCSSRTNREASCDCNEGRGSHVSTNCSQDGRRETLGQSPGQGHAEENSLSTDSLHTTGQQLSRKDSIVSADRAPHREDSCLESCHATPTHQSSAAFRSLKILELEYTAEMMSCRDHVTKANDFNSSKQLLSKVASNSGSFLIARLLEKSSSFVGVDDQWLQFYSPENVVYQPMGFQVETTQR